MSITGTDIKKRFSVAAAAGNTTAGTATGSLGDQISTTDIPDGTLDNLFDDVSSAQAAAGATDYRCFFVLNDHASLTALGVTVTVQSQTSGGAAATIALDNAGVTAKGSGSAQAATIADEASAPAGVGSFGAGPLTIGNIPPGSCAAVWVKRVTGAGAGALNPDGAVIRVGGDSLP